MNLYLISQDTNNGYDTYDSAVVCAESEDAARHIHPAHSNNSWLWGHDEGPLEWDASDWTTPGLVTVKLLGTAAPGMERGVVCASFNAG
jgi:hypothetical protein